MFPERRRMFPEMFPERYRMFPECYRWRQHFPDEQFLWLMFEELNDKQVVVVDLSSFFPCSFL
jgi:hypothetical protein